MASVYITLVKCLLSIYAANGQTTGDYLITNLPLYNNSNGPIPFKQYAGYMPLKDVDDTHMFFWFVESMNNPSTDPIFLWMNGGLGASSVRYGFWTEHGPFRLSKDSSSINLHPWSWNHLVNTIYIESPSGSGYSYSNNPNGYNCTDNKTSLINFLFLDRFFSVFTQFANNNLYISGESYGGHYIPQLSQQILLHFNQSNQYLWTKNMKGLIIGNPAIEGDSPWSTNYYSYFINLWSHALLPQTAWVQSNKVCGWTDYLTNCSMNGFSPTSQCIQIVNDTLYRYNLTFDWLKWDIYDVYTPVCDINSTNHNQNVMIFNYSYDPCLDNYTANYMNRNDVLKALHVYDEYIIQNRTWPNHPGEGWTYPHHAYDSFKMFNEFFTNPISNKWNITVYSGDVDSGCPHIDSQRWIGCLNRPLIKQWSNWYLYGDVAGSITIYDKIKFETIKYCGHMVPGYCPVQGLLVLQHYLTGRYQLTI
eukprot:113446_1